MTTYFGVLLLVYIVSSAVAYALIPLRIASWKLSYMTREEASLVTRWSPVYVSTAGAVGHRHAGCLPTQEHVGMYRVWAFMPFFNTIELLFLAAVFVLEFARRCVGVGIPSDTKV